jgi:PAS domain S-box-containing protein
VTKKRKAPRRPRAGVRELRNRLQVAEDTVRAITTGEVDALVVARESGEQVITLAGAELAYRILFDQMNEGAVTLTPDGLIAYCNRRFAAIVRTPLARVIGAPLRRFVPPSEHTAFEALRQQGSTGNARRDLRFRAGDGAPVPVAVSFAPLRAEGSAEVIGVVGVIRDITERARQEDLRNRLIEQVMTAQDDERRRIARELHDETGQSLTALLVGLRTIEGSQTAAQAVELARRLRETTAQTLIDVGRLWRGLHPGVLDDLGLAAAVTRHAEEFARAHGIAVNVRTEGLDADGLSALLQATVYRVLQEALTNVARHAGAQSVSVLLVRHATAVDLRVQDDGAGFESGNGGRLGLRGMRERAALLGGSVTVDSHPGAGTTITAHIPLRGA